MTDNPWSGDGSPPPPEAETVDEAFMRRVAEVAELDTLEQQLVALNGGNPIAKMDAELCGTVVFLANVYRNACEMQGHKPQDDVFRSLTGAAFQLVQPLASQAQLALGGMRETDLTH